MSERSLIFKRLNLFVVQGLNVVNVSAVHLWNFSYLIDDAFLKLNAVWNRNVAVHGQNSEFLLKDLDQCCDTGGTGAIFFEAGTEFSVDTVDFLFICTIFSMIIWVF